MIRLDNNELEQAISIALTTAPAYALREAFGASGAISLLDPAQAGHEARSGSRANSRAIVASASSVSAGSGVSSSMP